MRPPILGQRSERFFNGNHSECTAVVVTPDQALTAAHCLFEQATGHPMQRQSLYVLLGFVHATYQVDALVLSVRRWI
jgi:protease YdgD